MKCEVWLTILFLSKNVAAHADPGNGSSSPRSENKQKHDSHDAIISGNPKKYKWVKDDVRTAPPEAQKQELAATPDGDNHGKSNNGSIGFARLSTHTKTTDVSGVPPLKTHLSQRTPKAASHPSSGPTTLALETKKLLQYHDDLAFLLYAYKSSSRHSFLALYDRIWTPRNKDHICNSGYRKKILFVQKCEEISEMEYTAHFLAWQGK